MHNLLYVPVLAAVIARKLPTLNLKDERHCRSFRSNLGAIVFNSLHILD